MKLVKQDEVYLRIDDIEADIAYELAEYFTFFVPGYKFMPAYRNKLWDGKIRLFNPFKKLLYAGLIKHVEKFCKDRDYTFEIDDAYASAEYSLFEANEEIKTFKLPEDKQPRDYQVEAFAHCIRDSRALMVSPTASGKSLIIYMLVKHYKKKTLIIVPTTTLVHQLASDFKDYGFDSDNHVHKIFSGQDKDTDRVITITTWQSIYKQPKNWFDQYDVVIGDEAHLFKAKSLTSILEKMHNTRYRFGFTGTLDGTQTHKLVLEGLFGTCRNVITTSELMEKNHVAKFKIKAIVLKYSEDERKNISKIDYMSEMDYIVNHAARNRFIKNLSLSLNGNVLLLYQYVEKHGRILNDLIKDNGRNVYFIHGGIDGEERNKIRKIVNEEDNAIIIASYGTTSTGINIPNIHNIIFASPSKSRVRNLQSIGRGLRKSETKSEAVLYDIADDFSWKSKQNHTLLHFVERIKIYNEEKFEYKTYTVELK